MSWDGDAFEKNIVHEYEHWAVFLHESQTYLGRTYIALNRDGEVDPFTDTTVEEQEELFTIVGGLKKALDTLYRPDLLNYANLRNTWNHCHWHVIPRYETERNLYNEVFTDPNFGKNYAPYPKHEISLELFRKIQYDLRDELILT